MKLIKPYSSTALVMYPIASIISADSFASAHKALGRTDNNNNLADCDFDVCHF